LSIQLKQSDFDAIVAHARAQLPNEACGLVAGLEGEVKKVYFLTNIDASPAHFSLDPKEQLAALKAARAAGWRLLGNWHSHPATPARPSPEDIRLAYDPTAVYLILSLAENEPVLKAFAIQHGGAGEVPVVVRQ
jgi:proteasome lid subunit RPN8/RPN11